MFIGEYKHSIDEKGRVAVPVKFRSSLGRTVIITRGLDRCLFVFTQAEWNELAAKIKELPLTQSNSRAFARLMLSGAVEVDLDKQGRVLVPDYLRSYALLDKQTIFAGVYSRVEIWNEEKWNDYKTQTEAQSDEIAERLGELGI